ncbi:hypothetical protein QFZ52_001122 [Arthrobacter woluwensis]|nr:hypothetical protein [Arthrobacter woluwensis]
MDRRDPELVEDVGDLVIHGVHQARASREGTEPLAGQGQSLLVTVDADQVEVFVALQQGFRVAAHAEGGVDDHGTLPASTCCIEARGQQHQATLFEDRDVTFGGGP